MTSLRITPTNEEKVMREGDLIVSKTDIKGRITYGNRTFNEFSGFTENELLGTQHNIIRHPDMPRAVFKLLWDRLQAGQEVFAFVKNISKDGSFYSVLANVTPSYDAPSAPGTSITTVTAGPSNTGALSGLSMKSGRPGQVFGNCGEDVDTDKLTVVGNIHENPELLSNKSK